MMREEICGEACSGRAEKEPPCLIRKIAAEERERQIERERERVGGRKRAPFRGDDFPPLAQT